MSTNPLGILELIDSGSGFLRRADHGYAPASGDVHVAARLIKQLSLRPGDEIAGQTSPGQRGRGPSLTRVTAVNGRPPEELRHRPQFTGLRSVYPDEQLVLATDSQRSRSDYTARVIDLLCPFGKGQRALVVAPAKAGKTTVLQHVAAGVAANAPDATLMILLVDERPEEVTEMESVGVGEVIASSFDNPPERHVALAELTLERARRLVEQNQDVVLIVDSVTRLARAYNAAERGTGRTLSGGLDASSLEKPKRFLGSARRVDPRQGGGSLTIVATALVDTGSKMDQVIFEEFKGTGNSELVLSRPLAERRIFPAIDIPASGTRKEELLLSPDELEAERLLRQQLSNMDPADAMMRVVTLMKRTDNNAELAGDLLKEHAAR
ncbi:MAG TPA: transcription termination factor Rho [Gemmatimonadales bacterium]|nr:transcription termination factor Rho [Gemmatimonadales bacterium]